MGLVDELRLMVYPMVLGAGDRLFVETQGKIALRLVESRPFGGGVVLMIYAPATAVMRTLGISPREGGIWTPAQGDLACAHGAR
jgi:hypothetical protein